ncbi:MAG: class I SAM-dependent methyltransferase [Gemmatimonadaceae bacterium]|nr:class I SAM-dependent methyltransferase [Gemmatimonadaceae bacterium]
MTAATLDLAAIKSRQQAAWSSGDYAIVGTTLQIVGESLCEAIDLRAGARVLDVAAGNGNATLAAARRFATVTSTDYVPALLEVGRRRAQAEGLSVGFQEADAEQLPFGDGAFDVALSTFGVMFTADQARAARELTRVVRPGGTIGLANWTPESPIGELFRVLGRFIPPAPGLQSPLRWGTRAGLEELFGDRVTEIRATSRQFSFRYRSVQHMLEVFRAFYGPVHRAFAALDAERQAALSADIIALFDARSVGGDDALVLPSEYLEVVIEVA